MEDPGNDTHRGGPASVGSVTGRHDCDDGGVLRWERWGQYGSALRCFCGRNGTEVTGPPFHPSMGIAVAGAESRGRNSRWKRDWAMLHGHQPWVSAAVAGPAVMMRVDFDSSRILTLI